MIWAPLAAFGLFFGVAAYELSNPADRAIRSRLVGKPMPAFALPPAHPALPALDSAGLADGRPRLLNVFASWCVPCIAEAPILMGMAGQGVPIDAIAIRDTPDDVAAFLQRHGNPYRRIGSDRDSAVQLALGSSGVPETFVIDGRGVIRHQHIGDIRPEHVPEILDKLREAQ